ncbi:MAG: uroporphyrinogen-III synthase [Burkholderiales bacterium]
MKPLRVIVTRPSAQAAEWVLDLRARGIDVVALPLIDVAPADDATPLLDAWHSLERYRLVMFVSPNAVQHFFARRPAESAWPDTVFAGSSGPGTTRALVALGLPVMQIVEPAPDSPQFDSEALWLRLRHRDWRGEAVLIVRGDGGRDWLADTLRRHGASVTHVSAYRRVMPTFGAPERAIVQAALAEPDAHLWLFSSSEAIDNLEALAPAGADWQRARAIATHPRIADRARRAGFSHVVEARPSPAVVIACIQSIRP